MGPAPVANVTARCISEGTRLLRRVLRRDRRRRRQPRPRRGRDHQGHGARGADLHRARLHRERLLRVGRLVRGAGCAGDQPIARQPLRRPGRRARRARRRRRPRRRSRDHMDQLGRQQRDQPLLPLARPADRHLGGVRRRRQRHVAALQRLHRARWRALGPRLGHPAGATHQLRRLPLPLTDREPVHERPRRLGDRRPDERRAAARDHPGRRVPGARQRVLSCGSSTSPATRRAT